MQKLSLTVVIPVYNEARFAAALIASVLEQPMVTQVIVVDDASTDGTVAVLEKVCATDPRLQLLRHERNRGKGAALRTGFAAATGDIVLVQDADLEYSPLDYPALLQPIIDDRADVVLSSRFIGGGPHRVLHFWHSVGNKALTLLSNLTSDLNLTDVESCYKVFRRDVLARVTLRENRFGFDPEVVAKVARLRVRIYEVPISYYGRTYAEGKKIGWRDGFSALRCILFYGLLG